jgi:hypothetical protein
MAYFQQKRYIEHPIISKPCLSPWLNGYQRELSKSFFLGAGLIPSDAFFASAPDNCNRPWGRGGWLRDAARGCKGPEGVAEGYRGLREAVECRGGTPMVPRVTDLTDFGFSSQWLLIDTNNELKKNKK